MLCPPMYRSNKSVVVPTYLRDALGCFLSHSCTVNLAPSVSKSSLKGNVFELSDITGGQKKGLSRLHVLIG